MNGSIPIEVLICLCATSIIENKYVDDDMLMTIYEALEAYFNEQTESRVLH